MRQTGKFLILFCMLILFALSRKAFCEEDSFQGSINIGIDSGIYQIDYTHTSAIDSVNGRTTASQPTIGVNLFASIPLPVVPKYSPFTIISQAGFNYNFPVDNLSISYSFANIIFKNNLSFDIAGHFGFGALYSLWNQEISGGFGWQVLAGAENSEGLYMGLRYLSIPGSKLSGGYQSKYVLSQWVFDINYSF